MQVDLRITELLSSKICHDLISPVSAINNGVELVQEIGGDVVDEAMNLIGNSAQLAAHRLKLFRLAYGKGGADANLSLDDVRTVVTQYAACGKMKVLWPAGCPDENFMRHRGAVKTLINCIILSEELLAYGGEVSLVTQSHDGITSCRINIYGRNAQLSESVASALNGSVPVDEITPRTIQPYISGRFAEHYGLKIDCDQTETDKLSVVLTITGV